jgi:hypothetical protein
MSHSITLTTNGAFAIAPTQAPRGSVLLVHVRNESGVGSGNITFSGGFRVAPAISTLTLANGHVVTLTFQKDDAATPLWVLTGFEDCA